MQAREQEGIMLSFEEKQDLLIKKWKKLHPTINGLSVEDIRAQVRSLKGSEVKAKPPIETTETPFDKLARAATLADAKIMAKVICNGMYANDYITCPEWESIMAALDPQFIERRKL